MRVLQLSFFVEHVEVFTMGVAETEAFSWNPDSFVWNER